MPRTPTRLMRSAVLLLATATAAPAAAQDIPIEILPYLTRADNVNQAFVRIRNHDPHLVRGGSYVTIRLRDPWGVHLHDVRIWLPRHATVFLNSHDLENGNASKRATLEGPLADTLPVDLGTRPRAGPHRGDRLHA